MFRSSAWPLLRNWMFAMAVLATWFSQPVKAESVQHESYGIGHPATQAEIDAWNIDIVPNGDGLPPGKGTVEDGAKIYATTCASCHGATGTEGPMAILVGGQDTLHTDHPVKTVGSYWPFATTLFDYIYRAMPFTAPQSLSSDEVYAVVAWILFQNGIIEKSSILDVNTLPNITMPNHGGFILDPRPDVSKKDN